MPLFGDYIAKLEEACQERNKKVKADAEQIRNDLEEHFNIPKNSTLAKKIAWFLATYEAR